MTGLRNTKNTWLVVAGILILAVALAFKFVDFLIRNLGSALIIAAAVLGIVIFGLSKAKDSAWRFVAYFAILLVVLLVYPRSRDFARRYADNMSEGLARGFGVKGKRVPAPVTTSVSSDSSYAHGGGAVIQNASQRTEVPLVLEPCLPSAWDGEGIMENKQAVVAPIEKIPKTGERFEGPYWVLKGNAYLVCLDAGEATFPRSWIPRSMRCPARKDCLQQERRASVSLAYADGAAPEPMPDMWKSFGASRYITEPALERFFTNLPPGTPILPYVKLTDANAGEIVAVTYDPTATVAIAVDRPFKPTSPTIVHTNRGEFTAREDGILKFEVNTPYYRGIAEPTTDELNEGELSGIKIHIKEIH
jgi:hypothetical protein